MTDIIRRTTPTNIQTEKQKFFASDSYNPQFTYSGAILPDELTGWGLPLPKYTAHALRFIEHARDNPVPKTKEERVTIEEVKAAIEAFNQKHQLVPAVEVIFSENLVAKCKVGDRKIYFHLPVIYSKSQFADLCRHELETHMLRALNHTFQPWQAYRAPELSIRRTEEGWAGLHTYLYRENKQLIKSYVTYAAVSYAQTLSFREVYNRLRQFELSEEMAWRISLRAKRGLTDSSQPGGLTRDLCYFEGVVLVWDWLINKHNNPQDCYLGRLALSEIPTHKPQADLQAIRYPTFMENIPDYLSHISTIGEINEFRSLI